MKQLPGTDAARHGAGQVDLTVMIAAHDAFRRDLLKLTATANRRNLRDPVQRLATGNGWETFKRQLLQHHEHHRRGRKPWKRAVTCTAGSAPGPSAIRPQLPLHGALRRHRMKHRGARRKRPA